MASNLLERDREEFVFETSGAMLTKCSTSSWERFLVMLGSVQGGLCKMCGAGVDRGRFLHVQGAFRHSLVEMFIQLFSSQTRIFCTCTAEVLPSAHRATGSGIAVSFNRIMGVVSAFVASSGHTTTAVPHFHARQYFLCYIFPLGWWVTMV